MQKSSDVNVNEHGQMVWLWPLFGCFSNCSQFKEPKRLSKRLHHELHEGIRQDQIPLLTFSNSNRYENIRLRIIMKTCKVRSSRRQTRIWTLGVDPRWSSRTIIQSLKWFKRIQSDKINFWKCIILSENMRPSRWQSHNGLSLDTRLILVLLKIHFVGKAKAIPQMSWSRPNRDGPTFRIDQLSLTSKATISIRQFFQAFPPIFGPFKV